MPEQEWVPFDPNKAAAEYLTQNITSIVERGRGILKGAKQKVRLRIHKTYSTHLQKAAQKYSRSKSFFIRDEPSLLNDFYVPVGVSCSGGSVESASLAPITSHNLLGVTTRRALWLFKEIAACI